MPRNLLVGKTLPLPNDASSNNYRYECAGAHLHGPPRLRHFLSCRMYVNYQTYSAVAVLGKGGTAKLPSILDVRRELGCVADEFDPKLEVPCVILLRIGRCIRGLG
jgi:hypothetical protein